MNTDGIVNVTGMGDNMGGGLKESLAKFRNHHRDVAHALLNVSGIGTVTGEPVNKDEDRPPYEHQEYPKMLYHVEGRELVVESKAEEAEAKKKGFRNDPYTKPKIAVADAATEKQAQVNTNLELQAQIRALTDQIQSLKAGQAQ